MASSPRPSSSRRTPRGSTSSDRRTGHRADDDRAPVRTAAQEADMIVRIMGEGQVALAESHLAELDKLDEELL
ncbi:PspA-associated protein PspAA, partial [Streptomyces prasinus]|uniref:PspA-associated protein PspAA n=1 Tax=Streptomyces prasinus TaxID=67345 RepID=UPI003B96D262